jgi:hypothetical protein
VKTCATCGTADNPIIEMIPDEQNPHGELVQRISHSVRVVIEYLPDGKNLTLRQERQGWRNRDLFLTRRAIERDLCLNCINATHIRRQLNAEQAAKAKRLEQDQLGEENFYLLLADVDGCY